ncbi:MAG: hypothetical protein K1060chlam5_00592 [Candidatus Anoxychlamydiales bacterium]|nr:hypothetical protein [Candidatus Anoxychlamydiales bacterium]
MKKNIDKILSLTILSIFIFAITTTFFIEISCPKCLKGKNEIFFGNKNALVQVVIFEDFKCKYCKDFTLLHLSDLKKNYIDTNKIGYTIVPISFICGSNNFANAAIAIYNLKRDKFFDYLYEISKDDISIESKEDVFKITKNISGLNHDLFMDIVKYKIFDEDLEENLKISKSIMKRNFVVPTAYVNGHKVKMDNLNKAIETKLNEGN